MNVSCECCEIFKSTYFAEHIRTAASVDTGGKLNVHETLYTFNLRPGLRFCPLWHIRKTLRKSIHDILRSNYLYLSYKKVALKNFAQLMRKYLRWRASSLCR